MFTVREFRDLLRLLEEHPEWRDELRRVVLTEELLSLPGLVRELAEAQQRTEAHLEELAAAQQRTEVRLEQLAEAQQRTEARLEVVAARLEEMAEAQRQMAEAQRSMQEDIGRLKSSDLEDRYRQRGFVYFSRIIRRAYVLTPQEIFDLLDRAIAEGKLTEREADDVELADVIVRGRLREDQAEVYLVVEVSWGVGLSDVERAARRARLFGKTGLRAVSVVAGVWINTDAQAMADDYRVLQVIERRAAPRDAA